MISLRGNTQYTVKLPSFHHFSSSKVTSTPLCFSGFRKWDVTLFRSSSSAFFPQQSDSGMKTISRSSAASSVPPLGGSGVDYSGGNTKQQSQRKDEMDLEEIEDPSLLADSDSCFCDFHGVKLHHKICSAESSSSDTLNESLNNQRAYFPMILLHGFGSSVFSWTRIMQPLTRITNSKVLAFDRPAFGLTSRVNAFNHSSSGKTNITSPNPYSTMFSVLATLFFMDNLDAEKFILVGHSAGSLIAVDTYFEAPERVSALILVAPAILAPLIVQNLTKDKKDSQGSNKDVMNLFQQLCRILLESTKVIIGAIAGSIKRMTDFINSVYYKTLSAILRSTFGVKLIRLIIQKFGIPAVRAAWFDSKKVSDYVVSGYTKPMKVKGWDKALAEYTVAVLNDSSSKMKSPLIKKLEEITCPVLIVTGDTDRLVPAWNSERLSRIIPQSSFVIIKNCGHLPHEEKPEEFLSVVQNFLQRVFGSSDKPCFLY